MKNNKGITLVALIISIIVLIILAGIGINLSLGESGLFNKAKVASQKMEEASAREKLELVLLDLQADKVTDINYNEKEYIDTRIQENKMTVNGNIVVVDGWKFKIDRTTLEIVEDLGKGELEAIVISTPYVGTTSFTTKISYIYNEEEIEEYTYLIDNDERRSAEKEYTTEESLEAESIHTVKVIAKYKDGKTLASNIITLKTEPRTYLYNYGDECINLTGGWDGYIYIHPQVNKGEAGYFKKESGNYLEFGDNSTTKFGDGGFTTINEIDTTNYTNLCISIKNFSCNFIPRSGYPQAYNGYYVNLGDKSIISKQYREETNISEIIKVNVQEQKGILKFNTYCSGWGLNGSYIASCQIDRIWLEK